MSTTKNLILAKLTDWDAWISFVRTRATNTQIWDLINPNLAEKPASLKRLTEPQFQIPDDDALFDKVKHEAYKARKDLYKTKFANANDKRRRSAILSRLFKMRLLLTTSFLSRRRSLIHGTYFEHSSSVLLPPTRRGIQKSNKNTISSVKVPVLRALRLGWMTGRPHTLRPQNTTLLKPRERDLFEIS